MKKSRHCINLDLRASNNNKNIGRSSCNHFSESVLESFVEVSLYVQMLKTFKKETKLLREYYEISHTSAVY